MKQKIIDAIQEGNKSYWEKYPEELQKELSDEQIKEINLIDNKVADKILKLFKK